jgi:transposase
VQNARLWRKLLGVERTVIEQVVFDEEAGAVVASVRPRKGATRRCGICSRRCSWEDKGEGRRRWRTLDLGSIPTYLEADAPRVRCPDHGIVVVAFPFARHRARHSLMFEDQVAWLAKHTSCSAVEELMQRLAAPVRSRRANKRVTPATGCRRGCATARAVRSGRSGWGVRYG